MLPPQVEIYKECVAPLVDYCLEGYNVTAFTYGQTGSGKSYTMGSESSTQSITSESQGIISRLLIYCI